MDHNMEESISQKLKQIIICFSKVKPSCESINDETDIIEDLGLDSITIIQIISAIEKQFNIEFDDEELMVELFAKFSDLKKKLMDKLQPAE